MTRILSLLALLLPFALWPACYDGALLPRLLALHIGTAGALVTAWKRVVYPAILPPALCFIAIVTLSCGLSPLFLPALAEPLHFAMLLALACLGASLGESGLRTVMQASVVGGTVSAVICVAQALGCDVIPQTAPPAALFLNRNLLAEYLVTVIPAAYWLACRGEKGATIAIYPMSLALFLTGCRGAVVGLVLGFLVALTLKKRSNVVWGALLTLLLAGSGIFWLLNDHSQAVTERLTLWRCTLDMIAANPLGVGPGGWVRVLPLYDGGATTSAFGGPRSPHNDLLWLTAEYGLPGLACLLWGAWIVGKALIVRGRAGDGLAVTCAVTIGAFAGVSMFAFTGQNAAALFLPVLMVGYATNCR